MCPFSHSCGKLTGSPINPIPFWIHLVLETKRAFLLSHGFLSVECITSKTEPPGLYILRKGMLKMEEGFGARMTVKS